MNIEDEILIEKELFENLIDLDIQMRKSSF